MAIFLKIKSGIYIPQAIINSSQLSAVKKDTDTKLHEKIINSTLANKVHKEGTLKF